MQDFPNQVFLAYWKPVSSLELDIWHRWLHAHKIHILLANDHPLPKHLLTPNSSGRYMAVQSRKAGVQLSDCLKRFSSFVLLENTTYIKFIYDDSHDPSIPNSFYIIRMASKPPCVIIWLAFPGGTPGRIRNKVVKEVTNLISTLNIKQTQSWRDPTHHHEVCRFHPGAGDSIVSHELCESQACFQFSKPIERLMVRYDHIPSDFTNMLEPAFDSLSNKNGMKFTRRIVNIFGGIIHERPSSGTYLTLSRYLHHRRWIWTVQYKESPVLMPEASITRILTTLLRVRQMEGFTFAYSKNGIQTLMMELPMMMNGQNVSCVVQYVLFPPQTSSGSLSNLSTWSEDAANDGETSTISSIDKPEDESVQIITEVWVEPQDGIVLKDNGPNLGHNWDEVIGVTYDLIPKVIYPKDNEVISCLLTCEHLALMCQKSLDPQQLVDQGKTCLPEEEKLENSGVEILPIQWNLTTVLSKSQPVELLLPMFIQNLAFDSGKEHPDRSNEDLYKELIENIAKLHDQQINLLESDHFHFTQFLVKTGKCRKLKFPVKEPLLIPRRSVSSRMICNHSIKWICFIKAVTNSRTIVTMLPKTYGELKTLLVDDGNLAGNNPMAVKIVQKPIVPIPSRHPMMPNIPTPPSGPSALAAAAVPPPADNLDSAETSNNSSTTNLESNDSSSNADFRLKSCSISRPRKKSSISSSTGKESSSGGDQFRKRVFSSSDAVAADRYRARSMEAKDIDNAGGAANGAKAALPRPRTQTHSQIHRLKQQDHLKKKSLTPLNPMTSTGVSKKGLKKVWGSVTLPIYSFDVITTDIIAQVLHANNPKFKKHQWASVSIVKLDGSEKKAETLSEPLAEVEKNLRLHVINLQMIYYRSFVCSIFKSLQMHRSLHSQDVQVAVDNCEETIQEIHFTDFLLKACHHIQQDFKGLKSKEQQQQQQLELKILTSSQTCSDQSDNHPVMKKKFSDIVSNTFQLVPHSNDLFYYCPNQNNIGCIGDDLYPVPSRIRRDTRETTSSNVDETEDFYNNLKNLTEAGEEEAEAATASENNAGKKFTAASSLSLLSNATSELSDLNESRDDVIDFEPLFLQVSITIRHGKDTMITAPITQLPTCLVDLFKTLDCNKQLGQIDFSQLCISLDLLSFALPYDSPIQIGPQAASTSSAAVKNAKSIDRLRSVSLCSNLSYSDPTNAEAAMSEVSDNNDLFDQHKLPPAQQEALDNLIKDVKWMISDEIAFALTTHGAQINEFTLKTVAKHIKSSSGKPGCSSQTIPLMYVFGHEASHKLFLDGIEKFTVKGWKKVSCGDYIYFLQESLHPPTSASFQADDENGT